MEPQRVTADSRVKADLGAVALKYGPLVYNVETADGQNVQQPLGDAPLKAEWRPDLLGGVMVITGKWKDGSPMIAIPNYARMNRMGPPAEYLGDTNLNYAPGTTSATGILTANRGSQKDAPATPAVPTPQAGTGNAGTATLASNRRDGYGMQVDSKVWI